MTVPNQRRAALLLFASAASVAAASALPAGSRPPKAPASATPVASVPPDMLQALRWRSIGPFRGGRVLTVGGAPNDRNRFYFGAVNGGVWRTDDAGRTWQPIFDSAPVGSIGALAVAQSAPDTLYVGTGEADMRSDIAQGTGLYRSTDAGRTWTSIGLKDTQQIGRILVDPRNPDVVLVAALGHPYGPNAMRGVFRSSDGGRTWTKTLFRDQDTGAIDLAFAPGHPDIVYAALWQTRRPPWNVYPPSSGPGSGLYRSADGGRTWTHLTGHGLPDAPARIGIATTPARPDRVLALIDVRPGARGGGLYRSDDAGATWSRISTDPRILERAWYFSGITADPHDADIVYVCDTVLLRSTDGGAHFIPLKGDPTGDDFHTLWIDPADSRRRILGVDQGAIVSLNGGQTWSSWYNQPTGQFYHVSTDNRFPYMVYGAQQDTGAAGVPSRTNNLFDGIDMTEFHETAAGGESDEIAPDPDDPDIVYGGRVDRLNLKTGQMRDVDPTLAYPDDYRRTWTLPLVFGPDHALYFGNQRVFRSTDGGKHWQPASPDLTRTAPGVPATLDTPTAEDVRDLGPRRGVVYAIAPSPRDANLIWAGTDDGLVWTTADYGAHWHNVTPAGLSAWSKIAMIEPSHFDTKVAFVAIDRHRLDDQRPFIERTTDGGRSWIPIVDGIRQGGPDGDRLTTVNVVREDPVQRGLLFAGTERGAYVSFDNGDRWQPLQNGLPRTSVRDMTIHGDDLVLATHGRGFYILDDIAALRALAALPADTTRLFPLAPAIRFHPPRFEGTPKPRDEPLAPNPPDGAIIDYMLGQTPHTPVQIDILDLHGGLVRRYSSADPKFRPDLATAPVPPTWIPVPRRPGTTQGGHRLVWDLHYPLPAILHGGDPPPQPVWATTGTYIVALTVDGHTLRQKLQVVPDPRLHVAPEAFQQEFALARKIQADRIAVRIILRDAAALRARTVSTQTKAALTALIDPSTTGSQAHPPAPDGLPEIADRLASLAQAIDGADAAPSPDARAGLAQAEHALAAVTSRWNTLRGSSGHI
ncbi:WD40/YVTN/BNR-like repeat-containing protein [Lichenicoccus sp.]|uniref:WD40/YVTN/BNR-like repeat-containing protein n=1 Tax=Lichenicoccus sp. TaxID=2781899 RepID=UPI003D0FEBC9